MRWMHALTVPVLLLLAGPASAGGAWTLDHVEFTNQAGADEWMGQAETKVQLLHHDNRQMAFRESWRTSMSQTYSVDWRVPDVLVPGEAAPFELSETCAESTMGPGWPFSSTTMTPASLVAEWNTGEYQQVNGTCTVGSTVRAPALTWAVPEGKSGDTTRITVSAGPTNYLPVSLHFVFKWQAEYQPPENAADTPEAVTSPPGTGWKLDHVEFRNDAGADEWIGQAETRIQLLSHDNRQMAFRESWRSSMSQTYSVDWHVPDILVPGEAAPFALSETCAESTMGPGWPFSSTTMAPATLVAQWNSGEYLQVNGTCTVGSTVRAPSLTWKIPDGAKGDTATVTVSAGPTFSRSVTLRFTFKRQ